jgi:hypothetical protein
MRGFCGVVICLGLIFLFAPCRAQQVAQPLTLPRYDAVIATASRDAHAAAGGSYVAASRALADLGPIQQCAVLVGNSSIVFADNRAIIAQMQAARLIADVSVYRANWAAIADQIDAVVASPTAGTPSSDAAAVGQATAVLNGADFSSLPTPPKSVWQRMGDWIERMLAKIHIHLPHWHWPFPSGPNVPDRILVLIPEILLIVILVVVVGLLAYFGLQWYRARESREVEERRLIDLAETAEERDLVASNDFAGLRALASSASLRGDYRAGYRLVFLAVLVFLDSEGAIKLDRSKTNWEYLRSASVLDGLSEILAPLVHRFDEIWYGERPSSESDYRDADRQFDEIRNMVRARRGTVGASGISAQRAGRS